MRQILVVGPSWVGDMIMAQSLFMSLKAAGECEIDVLAPGWSLPILARMPEVRRGIVLGLGHGQLDLASRHQLGRRLARIGYDQAIVLPGSFKSALVPFFARIPQRTAFRGEMRFGVINDMRRLDKTLLPMTVQRFVSLGQPKGTVDTPPSFSVPKIVPDPHNVRTIVSRFGLSPDRPAIAFMPGAEFGPAKQWPSANFARLATLLTARGFQIWVLGSQKDREVARPIKVGNSQVFDLTGRTELGDAVDLLSLARAAITNDSGLMHVAAALETPLVAIFGSSSPEHTPPLSTRVAIENLRMDCAPCFKRICPYGHTRCLTGIEPARVLTVLESLFYGAPKG